MVIDRMAVVGSIVEMAGCEDKVFLSLGRDSSQVQGPGRESFEAQGGDSRQLNMDEFKVLEINGFLNTIDVVRQSSWQNQFSNMR